MDNINRQKATRYSEKEWRKYKDEIIAFHNDNKTQEQIVQILGQKGFYVTLKQLKVKLKAWECTRYIKLQPEQVKFLLEIFDRRGRQGKRSGVRFGKMTLNEKQLKNLQRTLRRHQQNNSVKSPTAVESFTIDVFTPNEPAMSPTTGVTLASPTTLSSALLPRQDDTGTASRPSGLSSNYETVATQLPMLDVEDGAVPHLDSQADNDDLDLFENGISMEIIDELTMILEDAAAPNAILEDKGESLRTTELLPKEPRQPARSSSESKDFAIDQASALQGNKSMPNLFSEYFGESIQAKSSPVKVIRSLYSTPNRESESILRPSNKTLSFFHSEWDPLALDDPFLNTSMATPDLTQLLEDMNLPPPSPVHCSTQNKESHYHSQNESQTIDGTGRQTLSGEKSHEDLGVHLTLLRQCMEFHHKEAGMEIFKDLLKKSLERSPRLEIDSTAEEVFEDDALQFDEAEARFDAAISERQQRYGFDHPATVQMCVGFIDFLLYTGDYQQEGDDSELKVLKYSLQRARQLLEKVLKTGFDDKVVRGMLGQDDPEPRPSATHRIDDTDLMEMCITGCAKRPHLIHALIESTRYTELYNSYRIFKTAEKIVSMGLAVKYKTDNGHVCYRARNDSSPRAEDDRDIWVTEEEDEQAS